MITEATYSNSDNSNSDNNKSVIGVAVPLGYHDIYVTPIYIMYNIIFI